jgi:hypothetical protein
MEQHTQDALSSEINESPEMNISPEPSGSPEPTARRVRQRCRARRRDRKQCRLFAQDPATGLCARHAALASKYAPTIDDSADLCLDLFESGRGGLDSTQGINTVLTNVIILLAQGRLSPRRASVITFALSLMLRSVVVMDRQGANTPPQIDWGWYRPAPSQDEPTASTPDHPENNSKTEASASAGSSTMNSFDAAEKYARLRT